MKIVIVEDEKFATHRLLTLVKEYDKSIEVLACIESIEETVKYLQHHAVPDLILLDIHLSDGYSFEIFKQIPYKGAVIFTTAYDEYALEAFQLFSVDYILKPVTLNALAAAINKFRSFPLMSHAVDYSKMIPTAQDFKKRFLGKIGKRLFFIDTSNIALFQADNKVAYLVDKEGNKYLIDYTLEQLEDILDPKLFFRLNRKFIVHINAIQQIKPFYNNRLKLLVKGMQESDEMIISRERVSNFRNWAEV